MPIDNNSTHQFHEYWTNPKIRNLLTTHREYLLHHESTKVHHVDLKASRPFFYNFYAYMVSMDIDPKLHWPTLMLSDIESPSHFDEKTTHLLIPDISVIEEIVQFSDIQ
jgi:hypothetical protein